MRSTIAILFFLTAAVSAAVAGPEVAAVAVPAPVEARNLDGAAPLQRRECKNTGCKCRKDGTHLQQAQYCGNCIWTSNGKYIISAKRYDNHIYECSPDGDCCDYGVSTCADKAHQCPRQ